MLAIQKSAGKRTRLGSGVTPVTAVNIAHIALPFLNLRGHLPTVLLAYARHLELRFSLLAEKFSQVGRRRSLMILVPVLLDDFHQLALRPLHDNIRFDRLDLRL